MINKVSKYNQTADLNSALRVEVSDALNEAAQLLTHGARHLTHDTPHKPWPDAVHL